MKNQISFLRAVLLPWASPFTTAHLFHGNPTSSYLVTRAPVDVIAKVRRAQENITSWMGWSAFVED
jgi:hypothetical protein